jgi:hypothetical protein
MLFNDFILYKINEFILDFRTVVNLKLTCKTLFNFRFNVITRYIPKTNDRIVGLDYQNDTDYNTIDLHDLKYLTVNCNDLPNLNSFKSLTYLDISQCYTEYDFVSVRNLTSLTYLDSGTLFVYYMPETLTTLKCLELEYDMDMPQSLTYLDCSYSYITDLNLPNLVTLYCRDTPISELSAMKNLTTLDCTRTNIRDLSMFQSLTSLTCEYTPIKTIQIPNLTFLDCSSTLVEDLSTLVNLTALDCGNTDVINLSNLVNLVFLNCNFTGVRDVSMLTNLTQLICFNSDISDISMLVNLTSLSCDKTANIKGMHNIPKLNRIYLA